MGLGCLEELRDIRPTTAPEAQPERDVTPTKEPQKDPLLERGLRGDPASPAPVEAAVVVDVEVSPPEGGRSEPSVEKLPDGPATEVGATADTPAQEAGTPPGGDDFADKLKAAFGAQDADNTSVALGEIPEVVVLPEPEEPEVVGEAEPPAPTPREELLYFAKVHETLAMADHPMPFEAIKGWDHEQMRAADAWAKDEVMAIEAQAAGVGFTRILPTRPSFIPEYGDVEERQKMGLVVERFTPPDPAGICGWIDPERAWTCGLPPEHKGEHEPI
jgi:hypothetical protein